MNVGVSALQTIIDGGALAARKRAAQASLEQADAQYRSVVLGASATSPTRCARSSTTRSRSRRPSPPSGAAATSHDIAQRRLALGDTTYVFVLLAQLTYQQTALAPRAGPGRAPHRYGSAVQALGGRLVESRTTGPGGTGAAPALPSAHASPDEIRGDIAEVV